MGSFDLDMIRSVALLADIPRFQTGGIQGFFFLSFLTWPLTLKLNSVAFSLQANYTDRATAAWRRS
jgi:hypothetical protein